MTSNTELYKRLTNIALQLAHVCQIAEREPAAYVRYEIHRIELLIGDVIDELPSEENAQPEPASQSVNDWLAVLSEVMSRRDATVSVTITSTGN